MSALDILLPWECQPGILPRFNLENPLGAIAENAWVAADLSGVAAGLGTRTPPHADVRIVTRSGRPAFHNSDANEIGSSAAIPGPGIGAPLTLFAQFYVDAAPGFVPTVPIQLSGSAFDYCYIGCGSSTFLSAYLRYSGAARTADISVTGGTFGKLLSCVFVVRSETDYQFWCNGQTVIKTDSPGTPTNQLNTVYGVRALNGAALVAGYARSALPADYALWLSNNPDAWADIFEPQRIWVPVSAGGSVTSLTLADAAHAHAADSLTLTTSTTLVIADAAHAHAADSLTLTTSTTLVIADATHAHTADNIGLSTATALAVQDAAHAHAADALTLTTASTLAVQDAAHAHAADNLTLEALTGTSLVVADATHAHAADGPVLTLQSWLAVADAWHAHLADEMTLDAPSGEVVIGSRAGRPLANQARRLAPAQAARRNVQTARRT